MKEKVSLIGLMIFLSSFFTGFTYNDSNVNFEYSQDWKIVEQKEVQGDWSSVRLQLKTDSEVKIDIFAGLYDGSEINMGNFQQSFEEKYKNGDSNNSNLIKHFPHIIKGYPAYTIVSKEDINGKKSKILSTSIYCNHKVVHFKYQIIADKYEDNLAKAEEVLNTVSGKVNFLLVCMIGTDKEVKHAIAQGVDINQFIDVDGKKIVPLNFIIRNGDLKKVKLLLEAGAKINIKNDEGNTPLIVAIKEGHEELVKLLVEKGADIHLKRKYWEPLMFAVENGNLDIIKFLIDQGADINRRTKDDGSTPLMLATKSENLQVMKFLIEKGADINNKDSFSYSPLLLASWKGNLELTKFLLEHGAEIETRGLYGDTPIITAAISGNLKVFKYLIEQGGQINARNKDGETALMKAASRGKLKAVKLLINQGAKITLRDNQGRTALDLANEEGKKEIVKYLTGLNKY